jgi:hypothetical protein
LNENKEEKVDDLEISSNEDEDEDEDEEEGIEEIGMEGLAVKVDLKLGK